MYIPNIIEKNEKGAIQYDLFSRMLKDRNIFLFGEINDELSANIIAQILYLDSLSHDDINIYINSPGGSVTAGLAIYDTINYVKSDVATICIGIAASMASLILSSGTKGKRYCLPNADVLIHQPLGGVSGQATEIEIVANRILNIRTKLNKILAKNTNQPIDKIAIDTERDKYFTSEEAINYGLADKIIANQK